MSVTIRNMTEDEFQIFYRWSAQQQAKELMEEFHLSYDAAARKALEEISGMLPDGLHTAHNHLMTIVAEEENVGFLWAIYEETEGRKQSFVCDFAIWEPKRRNGYGTAALGLVEKMAAEADCRECVLFVADQNTAAKTLYEKCGYRVLRQQGTGLYLVKPLKISLI